MEFNIFLRRLRVLGDELARGIEFAPHPVAVVEMVVARFTAQCGGATDFIKIPIAEFIPG
jgi:hypothetical protein